MMHMEGGNVEETNKTGFTFAPSLGLVFLVTPRRFVGCRAREDTGRACSWDCSGGGDGDSGLAMSRLPDQMVKRERVVNPPHSGECPEEGRYDKQVLSRRID